jgi:hypothetical protein
LSRVIDPENMSDADRRYLRDRAIDPDDYSERHRLLSEDEVEPVEPEEGQEPARLNQEGGPEADEDGDDEDVPYSEWTIAELRTEIEGRPGVEMPEGRARKGELIRLLEEDDQKEGPTGATDDPDEDESLDASDPQPANPSNPDRGVLNRE